MTQVFARATTRKSRMPALAKRATGQRTALALAVWLASSPLWARDDIQEATCRIAYRGDYNTEAPCTLTTQGPLLTVEGRLAHDGRRFIAVIDATAAQGVLTTTDATTLAIGTVRVPAQGTFQWDNGHVLSTSAP